VLGGAILLLGDVVLLLGGWQYALWGETWFTVAVLREFVYRYEGGTSLFIYVRRVGLRGCES
jgi:hypothetical protein